MREIDSAQISLLVTRLLLEANYEIPEDIMIALQKAAENENMDFAKNILEQIIDNNILAKRERLAICQDTGMVIAFVDFGQEVLLRGKSLEDALNEGVRMAYEKGYLRKSIVSDPLFERRNTGDNTPAILHTRIVPGDKIKIEITPKGFGSENMSALRMLSPSQGIEGLKRFVLETVEHAGPNTCPPSIIGVGVGGSFDYAGILAKKALLRGCRGNHEDPAYAALERELLEEVNALGIGPAGLGGVTTALAVNIEFFPTHIASIPVAVNMCCHAARHASGEI